MKIINFDGRIGAKGAELMNTKGGKPYVKFSVANNSFVNGQEKTEWFDVTSYDPFVIENKISKLTKGAPVQVIGTLNTEVKVGNDGKVWVNQYVNAHYIELMFLGKRDEETTKGETGVDTMSTVTGGTKSEEFMSNNGNIQKANSSKTESELPFGSGDSFGSEDDLPF